jgi:hypothetical protein
VYVIKFSSVVYARVKIKGKFAALHVMDTCGGVEFYLHSFFFDSRWKWLFGLSHRSLYPVEARNVPIE